MAKSLHMACILLYEHAFAVYGWIGVLYEEEEEEEEEVRLAVVRMRRFPIVLRDGSDKHNDEHEQRSPQRYLPTPKTGTLKPPIASATEAGSVSRRCSNDRIGGEHASTRKEATNTADIPFFCGDEHFTMTLVSPTVYMAHHFAENLHFPDSFRSIARGAPFWMAGFGTDGVIRYGDSLLDLFEYLRTSECSEPRDKVYAVLGMAIGRSIIS